MAYCGRFAPSPSGRLHWGSLVSGYASYFRAKSQQGRFIVRIEDLDFPRCPKENTPIVLEELELLGMQSDCSPIIQSEQLSNYQELLSKLIDSKQAYYCTCSRAQMKMRPCPCHDKTIQEQIALGPLDHVAIRIDLSPYLSHHQSFVDGNLGLIEQATLDHELSHSLVLKRADNIIAYNLAVVLDDHDEHISEVVRGADMLDATFLQLCLYEILGYQAPSFFHVPLIVDHSGNKLSKQNKAPAVLVTNAPHQALAHTYQLLGQSDIKNDCHYVTLNKLYQELSDLISTKLSLLKGSTAALDKKILTLHICELLNALLSYGYSCLDQIAAGGSLSVSAEAGTSLSAGEGKSPSADKSQSASVSVRQGESEGAILSASDSLDLDLGMGSYILGAHYLEPKILGYGLIKMLGLNSKDYLPIISEYRSTMDKLLLTLCDSFKEQNMPHCAIVI